MWPYMPSHWLQFLFSALSSFPWQKRYKYKIFIFIIFGKRGKQEVFAFWLVILATECFMHCRWAQEGRRRQVRKPDKAGWVWKQEMEWMHMTGEIIKNSSITDRHIIINIVDMMLLLKSLHTWTQYTHLCLA
jgi:hypothetical protein